MSCWLPNAASWRANMTSTPTSLASAVSTDVSLARLNAGSGGQSPSRPARVEEQGGELLGVGGAAAVAEGEQPASGREPGRSLGGALGQPAGVALSHGLPQLGDLGDLGHGRGPDQVQHRGGVGGPVGGPVGAARVEEGVERLDSARGLTRSPPASGPGGGVIGGSRRRWLPWRAPGSCRPRPATRATLTSSVPCPVSTMARPSASSRTTVTSTAVSEQVMQTSSPASWTLGGGPQAGRFTRSPPGRARRAARRTRAPAPTARDRS